MTRTTSRPLLQIIVPTYRRPAELERLLNILVENGYTNASEDLQVWVSENGGSENAREIAEKYTNILPLRYMKQAFPMGGPLHIFSLYAKADAEYLWMIGDDDRIDLPWPTLRELLASREFDFIRLGIFREQADGTHTPETLLKSIPTQGILFGREFILDNWLSMTFISGNLMRTDWLQPALPLVDFRNAYFPLELVLRASAAGCHGKFVPGKRVVGGPDLSWKNHVEEYTGVHLPLVAHNMRKVHGKDAARRMIRNLMRRNGYVFYFMARQSPATFLRFVLAYLPDFVFCYFPRCMWRLGRLVCLKTTGSAPREV